MNKFSVFMKSGGGSSTLIVNKYFKAITSLFKELSKIEYSKEIEQFHIELRVDGEFLTFGDIEGCNNLRFFKKKHLIANSISFGKNIYLDEIILHKFMRENLLLSFKQMAQRLDREKIQVRDKQLLDDLIKLMDEFLISPPA
jgi:hypothetical protein